MRDEELKKNLGLERDTPRQQHESAQSKKSTTRYDTPRPKTPIEELFLDHPLARNHTAAAPADSILATSDSTTTEQLAEDTNVTDNIAATPSLHNTRQIRNFKKPILALSSMVLLSGIVYGGYSIMHKNSKTPETKSLVSSNTKTPESVAIALYFPKNLPAGFIFNNDAKVLKADVYFYSITGPDNKKFYVTQQPLPTNFDFPTFNKKFLKPDSFSSSAGSVMAGTVGANMLGSIQTNKNTWILINTDTTLPLVQLETVIRSLSDSK